MPKFFRRAVDRLAYLNPEPDRWRDEVEAKLDPALNAAFAPDHFIDLELVPEGALAAADRYAFAAEIIKAGGKPPLVGLLPYRVLELFQRLRSEFRLWRAEPNETKRRWIEERIINDAGTLGHYVTDGANPHHTTVHYNGWVGDNPRGYTTERGIHARFEDEYVRTHIRVNDLTPLIGPLRKVERPREEILAFLRDSWRKVEELYELDKRERFGEMTTSPEHKRFTTARLAVGAQMLRDLWWTAWVTSADGPSLTPLAQPRGGEGRAPLRKAQKLAPAAVNYSSQAGINVDGISRP